MTIIVTKSGEFEVNESYDIISENLHNDWIELTEDELDFSGTYSRKILFNVSEILCIMGEFKENKGE